MPPPLQPSRLHLILLALALLIPVSPPLRGPRPSSSPPPTQPYTWRNVTIIAGGFMPGIVFHPATPGLAYIRADIGGAYRWDASQSGAPRDLWTPLVDWAGIPDWNDFGIESLAVDPSDPNRLYLAAGMYTNAWAGMSHMLRSPDQGRTWQSTPMPFKMGGNEPGRSMGERLAVDPNDSPILFFGSRHNGLWKSTDASATWSPVPSFPLKPDPDALGIGMIVFDPRSGKKGSPTPIIYAGVEQGPTPIFRSTDAGATWQPLAGQPTGLMPQHIVLASDGTLYISYSSAPGPNDVKSGAVWRFNTADQSWTDITPLKPTATDAFGYAGLSVDAQHPQTVMASTLDHWGPGDDIFRSTDSGKTWKSVRHSSQLNPAASPYLYWVAPEPRFGWWIGSVEIDPFDSNHVLYVTGATVWGCHDMTAIDAGQTVHWSVAATGIEETAVIDLISPPNGPHLLSALGDVGGFRHDDLTRSPPSGMMSNPIFSSTTGFDEAADQPNLIVRSGYSGDHHGAISTDLGATWQPFASEPTGAQAGSIAISADAAAILWAPDKTDPVRSLDMGKTWIPTRGLPQNVAVISDPADPNRFYAIEQNIPDGAVGFTLFVSTNRGATFHALARNLPRPASRLRIIPGHPATILLPAEDAGLWASTNAGASFSKWPNIQQANAIGFGAPAPNASSPALYLCGEVAGTYGIFRSDDAGKSWIRINDNAHQFGLPHCITGDPRIYGRVYLGTNGRGILYADPATR